MSTPGSGAPTPDPQDRLRRDDRPGSPDAREMPVIGGPGTPVPHAPGAPLDPVGDRTPPGRRPADEAGADEAGAADSSTTQLAVFGDVRRSGRWRVPARIVAAQVFGDVRLDLREAEFTSAEVRIDSYGAFGDLRLYVLPGTDVEVRGFTLFGDHRIDPGLAGPSMAPPDCPRIVVTGYGVFGDIRVVPLQPGEEPRTWWRRRRS